MQLLRKAFAKTSDLEVAFCIKKEQVLAAGYLNLLVSRLQLPFGCILLTDESAQEKAADLERNYAMKSHYCSRLDWQLPLY